MAKPSSKIGIWLLAGCSGIVVLIAAAIAQAGGWDNFKLQNFALMRIFHDQTQELDDLGTVIPSTTAFAFVYPAFHGTP